MNLRLQKFLAHAGIASRRASETLITAGHVTVNGAVVRELGSRVDPAADRIAVDGRPVTVQRRLYLALHKPRGVVCSRSDPQGRRTVLDLLPREWSSVYPVGRLDYETEGLLLLTNDGDFCFRITHPRYGLVKKYLVTIDGRLEPEAVKPLIRGVFHEGERLRADRVRILEATLTHTLLDVELSEGKNREIRRLFDTLNRRVLSLRRIQIGPLKLGELPSGRWRVLSPTEVRTLMAPSPTPRRKRPTPPAVPGSIDITLDNNSTSDSYENRSVVDRPGPRRHRTDADARPRRRARHGHQGQGQPPRAGLAQGRGAGPPQRRRNRDHPRGGQDRKAQKR